MQGFDLSASNVEIRLDAYFDQRSVNYQQAPDRRDAENLKAIRVFDR